jgi:hypothetical protein
VRKGGGNQGLWREEEISEEGKKVAYFGIHPETGRAKSHSSFNPELYLYRVDGWRI